MFVCVLTHLVLPHQIDDLTVGVPPGRLKLHKDLVVGAKAQPLDRVLLVEGERGAE